MPNADGIAMILSEHSRIEDGRLANGSYLAVKIAEAVESGNYDGIKMHTPSVLTRWDDLLAKLQAGDSVKGFSPREELLLIDAVRHVLAKLCEGYQRGYSDGLDWAKKHYERQSA